MGKHANIIANQKTLPIIQVISISKDRRALVWDMKKLKKHAEMGWDPPNNSKYAYKRVR